MKIPIHIDISSPVWYSKKVIQKHYPKLYEEVCKNYEKFNISWIEAFYLYIHEENEPCGFCKYCGKPTKFYSWKRGYQDYCSAGCVSRGTRKESAATLKRNYPKGSTARKGLNNIIKQNNLKTYGVEWASQREDVKEKIKETNTKRYGSYCSSKSKVVKETTRKNNLAKYGVENPSSLDWVKEKREQTARERYGVENVFASKKIQEKIKETNLEKYGCENPQQNKEVKEKTKQTNIDKYGVDCVSKSEKIKDKVKQTNLKKYGVENAIQCTEIKRKSTENKMKRFVENSGHITGLDGEGNWICECPHLKECNKCKEKTYVISSSLWHNRKIEGTEPCTKLKPPGAVGPTDIELMMSRVLERLGEKYETHKRDLIKSPLKKQLELDFYIPSRKIGIEMNGCWWHCIEHSPFNRFKHKMKWDACKREGIELLYFWSEEKEEDIEEFLRRKFNHESIESFEKLWYPTLKEGEHNLDLGWRENMSDIKEYSIIRSKQNIICYSVGVVKDENL